MAEEQKGFVERRKSPRYLATIPATIAIVTSGSRVPLEISGAMIRDVGRGGLGMTVTLTGDVTQQEMGELFGHRGRCNISCQFPGSDRTSSLSGTIVWLAPKRTAGAMQVCFGVNLEGNKSDELVDLERFIESQKSGP